MKLPELNGKIVTVIPINVTPGGDHWFADVEFNVPANARSYNPFVQLAVARYQPDTVDGLFISRVVITKKVTMDAREPAVSASGNRPWQRGHPRVTRVGSRRAPSFGR